MSGIKKTLIFLMMTLLFAMGGTGVSAAAHRLPDSFLIGDENGISVDEEGEYGIYIDDLNPGDVITRSIIIRNLETNGSYALSMTAEPLGVTGPVDLLDNMLLKLSLDGRLLYEGRLRGDGVGTFSHAGTGVNMIRDALALGGYNSGDYGKIDLEISLDVEHINYWTLGEKSTAEIRWRFDAVKTAGGMDSPKTGDIVRWGLYALLILLLATAAIVYRRYKKLKGRAACETQPAAHFN
jgi:hypothetical protein